MTPLRVQVDATSLDASPSALPQTPVLPELAVESVTGGFEHADINADLFRLFLGLFEDHGLDSYVSELAERFRGDNVEIAIKKAALRTLEATFCNAARKWFVLLRPPESVWGALRSTVNEQIGEQLGFKVNILPSADWLHKNPDGATELLKTHFVRHDGGEHGCSIYVQKKFALQNLLATPSTRAVLLEGTLARRLRTAFVRGRGFDVEAVGVCDGLNELISTDAAVLFRSRQHGQRHHTKSVGKLAEAGALAGENGALRVMFLNTNTNDHYKDMQEHMCGNVGDSRPTLMKDTRTLRELGYIEDPGKGWCGTPDPMFPNGRVPYSFIGHVDDHAQCAESTGNAGYRQPRHDYRNGVLKQYAQKTDSDGKLLHHIATTYTSTWSESLCYEGDAWRAHASAFGVRAPTLGFADHVQRFYGPLHADGRASINCLVWVQHCANILGIGAQFERSVKTRFGVDLKASIASGGIVKLSLGVGNAGRLVRQAGAELIDVDLWKSSRHEAMAGAAGSWRIKKLRRWLGFIKKTARDLPRRLVRDRRGPLHALFAACPIRRRAHSGLFRTQVARRLAPARAQPRGVGHLPIPLLRHDSAVGERGEPGARSPRRQARSGCRSALRRLQARSGARAADARARGPRARRHFEHAGVVDAPRRHAPRERRGEARGEAL